MNTSKIRSIAPLVCALMAAGGFLCPVSGQTTTSFQPGVTPDVSYDIDAVYIRSGQGNQNEENDTDLEVLVGYSGTPFRGLLEFDISEIPSSDIVDSVSLFLKTRSNQVGSGSGQFDLYEYAYDIDETTATWAAPAVGDADPTDGGTIGSLLGSVTFNSAATSAEVTFADSAAFRTAIENALAGDGFVRFLIKATNESNYFARFADENWADTSFRPKLTVTHTPSGPDLTAPTLDSTDPVDGELNFYAGSNLVATFSEDIALTGAGSITLTDLDDGTGTFTITLPDGQVSVSGDQLTINPTSLLEYNTAYEVTIGGSAIEDLAASPNAYAGTTSGEWNFTTLPEDLVAPAVSTLSPADDATDVSIVTDLIITFDEPVTLGSGNITIKNLDVPGDTVIDVTDDTQVTLAGSVLTIDPNAALALSTNYAVQIDAGIVVDPSTNVNAAIADDTTWNFTTESFPDPVAYWPMRDALPGTSFAGATAVIDDPSHGATSTNTSSGHSWGADPERGVVLVTPENNRLSAGTQDIDMDKGFTWSLWVKTDGNQIADSGADVIIGSRNGTWNKLQVGSWERWVGIGGYNLDDGQWHHVVGVGSNSPSTLVSLYVDGVLVGSDSTLYNNLSIVNDVLEIGGTSAFGEDMAGSISDVAIWEVALPESAITDLYNDDVFLVEDLTAPVLAATTPVDEEASATALTLQAIFDELITIGTGDIRIVNLTTLGTTTIAVTDASQVMVSGASITITPAVPLVAGETYAVEMDAGVVTNKSAGLPFAGILDQTTWNFTVDSTAPAITATDPADDSPIFYALQDLTLTFDEPISIGTGDILFKNLTDATTETIDVTDASRVTVTTDQIIINPYTAGIPGKDYAVQIDPGVVADLSGNPFVGIADDTSWNFTCATAPVGGVLVDTDFVLNGTEGDVPPTGSLEQWTHASNGGLYDDTVPDPDTTYATSDIYCAELYSGGNITTTEPLGLHSFGYQSVTIQVAHKWLNPSTTRRFQIQYAADGVNFVPVAQAQQSTGTPTTVTLTERSGISSTNTQSTFSSGYSGEPLTDAAKFRIFYSSNNSSHRIYIDDITITGTPDTTAPTVVSIEDDVSGGPINSGDSVVYTVTFDEAMDASSVETGDFENGGTAGITVDSVVAVPTADDASVFAVTVTTTSDGDLTLQIAASTLINDFFGNALDTGSAIPDDTTITVEASGGGTPYETWATGGEPFGDDANGDGVSNGLAFLLGAAGPNDDATGLQPNPSYGGGGGGGVLILTFNCLPGSARGASVLNVEYDGSLEGPWISALVPGEIGNTDVGNVNFDVSAGPGGLLTVVATIDDATEAAGGKLFGRLSATE